MSLYMYTYNTCTHTVYMSPEHAAGRGRGWSSVIILYCASIVSIISIITSTSTSTIYCLLLLLSLPLCISMCASFVLICPPSMQQAQDAGDL